MSKKDNQKSEKDKNSGYETDNSTILTTKEIHKKDHKNDHKK
jgi:hypothetical protein